MNDKIISERAQQLLKILVERYIRDGQPVGSRTLAEDSALSLSSASIRNVLADLENMGYLESPHTSSGRIPTAQGYRFFVDSLLEVKPLDDNILTNYKLQIENSSNTHHLLNSVSSLLSGITQLAGVATMSRPDFMTLRQVEFLPLSTNKVLVILVLHEQEVQNRVITTERVYSSSELQQAANYINSIYAGRALHEIRQELLLAMRMDRQNMETLMQSILDVADKALQIDANPADLVVAGHDKLCVIDENSDARSLRSLFEAFASKRDILHLLDQCSQAQAMQIFIGHEAGYSVLDDYSVIMAPYSVTGKVVGVLGVIGPTRMSYERVIPIVDVTAKLLTAALNK